MREGALRFGAMEFERAMRPTVKPGPPAVR
jgi:hypothetical protein